MDNLITPQNIIIVSIASLPVLYGLYKILFSSKQKSSRTKVFNHLPRKSLKNFPNITGEHRVIESRIKEGYNE